MPLDLSMVIHSRPALTSGNDGQKVRIISIPKFSEKAEIVLVNLSTLESEVIRFSSGKIKKVETEITRGQDVIMSDIDEL